jgi:hypothetical protein
MMGPPSIDCRPHVHVAGGAPDPLARSARWIVIPPQIDPQTALPNLGVYHPMTTARPQPY